MKNKIYLLFITLAAFGLPMNPAPGDNGDATPEPVIVPYDLSKPLDSQKPDRVYISHERFLQLWEAAKANKQGIQPEKMPQSFVLSNAHYDATLDDTALHVTGVIEVQTFNEGWVTVPLRFNNVRLGVLKLDGQPAPLAPGGVAVEKAGHHRIEAQFDIPLGSDRTHLAWGIPVTAGTLFSITLPDKQMKATVQPGDGVVERIDGDRKIVTAALGATDHVDLALDSSVGLATIKQAALVKIDTALSITPAVEIAHSVFDFSFPEAQQDHFTVLLDKALSLVKLDVPNLKSWKLTVGNDSQTLDITLGEPAREAFKFSIDAERTLTDQQRRFPYISAAANRVEETAALFTTPFLDVTPQPTDALRQVSYPEQQGNGLGLVAAFVSTGDKELLAYGVQAAKASNKARISYVYLVNHSKVELVAALKLQIKNAAVFDITVGLPADFTVEAVQSDWLRDWWLEDGMLHVRFKGGAPGAEKPLLLHLVKLYKTTPDALEITPLALPASWDVEGSGIIAAGVAVQPEMTLTGAKEIDPQYAATDFRILPPMERKRGFSFKDQKFHASVKLATLPARVDGTWVMSAQAHESWVSLSTHVNLTVRQGSTPGISFRLPASMPEARITGDNVRETSSAVDGQWRVYQVAFQNDVGDKTDFTVDFDLPGDGTVSLPSFEFLGVERSEGFVIVDNASEYVMQVQPSGLDVALSEQIPFLPQVSRNASLYRAQRGWSLQIKLSRLEKEAGRSAFVEWAKLSTAIRADGSEWHRALYHLQNHSLQFFPVKLPEGSELASVTVAGENVRADRGKVDGKDVLLVPLIKSNSWDLPYDVVLVYRSTKAKNFWTFSHESLADPEVVGISVERTLWYLYVPEGSDASHFGGNMEQVLEEVNETEIQQGTMEEIKSLESVASNPANPIDVQEKAGENARKLSSALEEGLKAPAVLQERVIGALGKDTAAYQKQTEDVAVQKQEILRKLQQQKYADNENMARTQQAAQAAQAAPAAQALDVLQNRVVTQSWANNGSYKSEKPESEEADKAKSIDRQTLQGRKLYVNDSVVNAYSGTTTVSGGALNLAGANTYTGGTVIAAGNAPAFGPTSLNANGVTILNGGAGSGTLVQNQISQIQAQQNADLPAQRAGATFPFANIFGGGQVTSGLRSGGEAIKSDAIDQLLNPSSAQPNQAGAGAEAYTGSNSFSGNVTVLGDARANPDINSVGGGAGGIAGVAFSGNFQARVENAAAGEGAGAGEGQGQGELAPGAGGLGVIGSLSQSQVVPIQAAAPAAPAQLQAAGAISLPIDFPTDGLRVYYFNKLNTNARLSFWLTNKRGLDQWEWLAVFLVAAVALKAIFICIDRGYLRVLRRRIVHI